MLNYLTLVSAVEVSAYSGLIAHLQILLHVHLQLGLGCFRIVPESQKAAFRLLIDGVIILVVIRQIESGAYLTLVVRVREVDGIVFAVAHIDTRVGKTLHFALPRERRSIVGRIRAVVVHVVVLKGKLDGAGIIASRVLEMSLEHRVDIVAVRIFVEIVFHSLCGQYGRVIIPPNPRSVSDGIGIYFAPSFECIV